MQVLRRQVQSLTMHQKKLVESSEEFQTELKKHCVEAVSEARYQEMVVEQLEKLKEERAERMRAGAPTPPSPAAPQDPQDTRQVLQPVEKMEEGPDGPNSPTSPAEDKEKKDGDDGEKAKPEYQSMSDVPAPAPTTLATSQELKPPMAGPGAGIGGTRGSPSPGPPAGAGPPVSSPLAPPSSISRRQLPIWLPPSKTCRRTTSSTIPGRTTSPRLSWRTPASRRTASIWWSPSSSAPAALWWALWRTLRTRRSLWWPPRFSRRPTSSSGFCTARLPTCWTWRTTRRGCA